MILDNTLVLSDSQTITATALSTNIIDMQAVGQAVLSGTVRRDVGIGTDIPLLITVPVAFNNLTSLTVQIEVDDDPAFASPKVVAVSAPIPLATLTAGYRLPFPSRLPEGTNERFLGLRYTVTGVAPTTGKITAAITAGNQTN